jgi:hypothetical protein
MQDSRIMCSKLYTVAPSVEALRCKVEGCGFDSQWGHSGRTMVLGSTQFRTDPSTRGKGGQCIGLSTLPPSCVNCLEVLGASTSWILKDLSSPVMGQLCLLNFEIWETAIGTPVTRKTLTSLHYLTEGTSQGWLVDWNMWSSGWLVDLVFRRVLGSVIDKKRLYIY